MYVCINILQSTLSNPYDGWQYTVTCP